MQVAGENICLNSAHWYWGVGAGWTIRDQFIRNFTEISISGCSKAKCPNSRDASCLHCVRQPRVPPKLHFPPEPHLGMSFLCRQWVFRKHHSSNWHETQRPKLPPWPQNVLVALPLVEVDPIRLRFPFGLSFVLVKTVEYTVSAGKEAGGLPHCTESDISILNRFQSMRLSF